jgi:hypothetical protein
MRKRLTLVLAGLAAALLMGLAASSTPANRLSITNTKFRIQWAALEFFPLDVSQLVRCPVTIEGSFHSATIRKNTGVLIGAVTRGIVKSESCMEGPATILPEFLPWHVTYEGFVGTLPNITNVRFLIRRIAYQVRFSDFGLPILCLYREAGRVEENFEFLVTRQAGTGNLTTVLPSERRSAALFEGVGACPFKTAIAGVGQMFLLGNTTRITLTLI